jgi:hypothetical protein
MFLASQLLNLFPLWYNLGARKYSKNQETKRNMQYAVPQFTEVEDKLIGPLTLKQFLILFGAGLVVLFFYSILGLGMFFYVFSLPVVLLGLTLAWGTFNGRPINIYLGSFFAFVSKPQTRVFQRVEPTVTIRKIEKAKPVEEKKTLEEPAESRLRKLAYLLDQKTIEEQELIKHR